MDRISWRQWVCDEEPLNLGGPDPTLAFPIPEARRFAGETFMAERRRVEVQERGEVTIVRFVDRKILDESNIQELGQELFQLVEDENRK
ncbi:MAG TPA: hypothetical protein VGY55_16305, partial [Pirellulales bacterium]|nr:hypothetical protein [Pirellulales bacterium]